MNKNCISSPVIDYKQNKNYLIKNENEEEI